MYMAIIDTHKFHTIVQSTQALLLLKQVNSASNCAIVSQYQRLGVVGLPL